MDITSANSVLTILCANVNPVSQNIQGYAADEAFDDEPVETAEAIKGVDGVMSAGFVPWMTKWVITLQADSPSIAFFYQILSAMRATKAPQWCSGGLVLPSVSEKFTLQNGVLTRAKQIPSGKKVLGPQTFELTWDAIIPANT